MKSSLLWRRATTGIAAAIIVVLVQHWHLAIHHVHDLHLHGNNDDHLILPSHSLATFINNNHRTNNRNNEAAKIIRHQEASRARYNNSTSYILSPICGGCFRSRSNEKQCTDIIKDRLKEDDKLTLANAMAESANVVGLENKDCKMCNADYCLESHFKRESQHFDQSTVTDAAIAGGKLYQTKYWRFDRSNPQFTNPTSLVLTSIPPELRIPPSQFSDVGAYFRQKFNSALPNKGMDFYMEYNPGLATIPTDMKRFLPEGAAYLLSLRVTPANNCFRSSAYSDLPKDVWKAVYQTVTNHLGLALLDENYRTIPGYDVVIDLGAQLNLNLKRQQHLFDGPNFMDYRLFTLNDEIYLHANADTVAVTKISLGSKLFGNAHVDVGINNTLVKDDDDEEDKRRLDQPYKLENLYGGNNLQVTLMHQFNTIWSGGFRGKNYALFSVPNQTHPDELDSIYAEIDITERHRVQRIDLEEYNQLPKRILFGRLWTPGTQKSRKVDFDRINLREVKEIGNITESDNAPLSSFSTVDEHWFPGSEAPFKISSHGGACCVTFTPEELNLTGGGTNNNNHHESLLVGIAHTKVPWRPFYGKKNVPQAKKDRIPHTHYVSFIYAFDAYPPFQIRARSGFFCLGHIPLTSDGKLLRAENGIFNPRSILTRNRMLQQNNVTFDCPQVHYISAFIEKVGDSSKTVIAYGLNDCTGRLIEVEKEEIVRLLYPDPKDMVFEAT